MARHYRRYSDIKWGNHWNSESGAHECEAGSAAEAASILGIRDANGFHTMQVKTGLDWQWVTETPAHLGGIFTPA